MKKIKYLFGLFAVLVGLLIGNSSFAGTIYIDGVVPGNAGFNTDTRSAQYQYKFQSMADSRYNDGWSFLGYSLGYNGNIIVSALPYCSTFYPDVGPFPVYNTGLFSYSPFSAFGGSNYYETCRANGRYYNTTIKVWLGQSTNFGKVFVGLGSYDSNSAKFGFGNSFFTSTDWLENDETNSTYYRLFFNRLSNGNNPLDGFDLITMTGSTQTGVQQRQYFTPRGTRTNYGYIVDDGLDYTKYKHFGLFDMGYSYVYGTQSQTSDTISWNKLKFRTIDDSIEVANKLWGDLSFSDITSYSWPGLLLVRGNQYVSFGNDDGVYILSKDPNNLHRMLYEHWSCNITNITTIFSGGDSSVGRCVKLDGGYLTYNGSVNVLPFTSTTDTYSITGLNSDYPLLYDLVNGGNGLSDVHGYTRIGSSCLYINQDTRCYGFTSNSSVNIKDLYLNGGTNISTSQNINESIITKCLTNENNFRLKNMFLCNSISSYLSGTYALGSGYYYQYSTDSSGNVVIEIIDQAGLFDGFTTNGVVWVQDSNGNWVTNCTGGWCNPNPDGQSGSVYLTGDGTNGFYVSEWYYDVENNSTGMFFKCPYPYKPLLTLGGYDFSVGGFDLLLPINCMIGAFNYGKSFTFLSNIGLNGFGPLISGNTSNHNILFRFFDIVLCIGLFIFYKFIRKLL